MKKMIVICGYLASGKSTFAGMLSERLGLPCFIKDEFKTALCQHVELSTRAEKSRFSAVTFDAMCYTAERLMQHGFPLILEGNFVPAGVKAVDEAGALQALIDRYRYDVLTYHFTGDPDVLHQRFTAREATPGRGDANRIGKDVPLTQFTAWCRPLEGFRLTGRSIPVDTSDFARVDYAALFSAAERFCREI